MVGASFCQDPVVESALFVMILRSPLRSLMQLNRHMMHRFKYFDIIFSCSSSAK